MRHTRVHAWFARDNAQFQVFPHLVLREPMEIGFAAGQRPGIGCGTFVVEDEPAVLGRVCLRSVYGAAMVNRQRACLARQRNGLRQIDLAIVRADPAAKGTVLRVWQDYSMEVEANLIPAILSWRPAGLILTSTEHTEKVRTMLGRSSVPTIEIWELPDDPIDMAVGYSNFAAGYEMARFLYDTGRRNIAFIGGTSRTVRTRLRRGGYLKALEDVGGTVPPEVPFDRGIPSIVERAAAGMDWIFKNCPDVDAVLCMNDWTAMGVISEVWRHGKSVPGDIAVSGFGDVDFGKTRGLGITTVGIPGFKVGETAARLILERVRNSNSEPKVIDLGFEIIRRATA
jgi:LacI family gluconate utilization system Gnt-I transcriptional repressor